MIWRDKEELHEAQDQLVTIDEKTGEWIPCKFNHMDKFSRCRVLYKLGLNTPFWKQQLDAEKKKKILYSASNYYWNSTNSMTTGNVYITTA